jgi:hypothetical protein
MQPTPSGGTTPMAASDPSWEPFLRYLAASVTDAHPTAPNVRDFFHHGSKVAKEIAYQQKRFLEFGKALLDSAPWVTYLTCLKHPCVAERYKVAAASFPEISDKSYWDALSVDVQATERTAKARLDEQTVKEVEQLCLYQVLGEKIAEAPKTLLSLRQLRSKFNREVSDKPWQVAWGIALAAELLLAALYGAAESHSAHKAIRLLLILVGIVAGISFIVACFVAAYNGSQRGLRKVYVSQFADVIAPCMRLAEIDPAEGFDNLEYAQEVVEYVRKNYEYLKARLLEHLTRSSSDGMRP